MDEEELTYAELKTVNDNDVFYMELGADDESDGEIDIEENSFYDDEFVLNDSLCASNNSVQEEHSSSASDIINQVAIGYLGDPLQSKSQKFNFNQSSINLESSQNPNSSSKIYLDAKEASVKWAIMPPKDGTFAKYDADLKPILNIEGDKILSFFNQLISESILENICNRTNEYRNIDISIEELRCYIGLLLLFVVLKRCRVDIGELWSSTSLDYIPQAQAAMTRNRFSEITQNLIFKTLN